MSNRTREEVIKELFRFEDDELDKGEALELLADLVRTGDAWKLQGYYGRQCAELIETGCISKGGRVNWIIASNFFGTPPGG